MEPDCTPRSLGAAETTADTRLGLAPAQNPPVGAIDEDHIHTILIIGKSGHGKSSLGNILLGREQFAVGRGFCSTTSQTEAGIAGNI